MIDLVAFQSVLRVLTGWLDRRERDVVAYLMPPFAVEVHPLAADEAEAAESWYRGRNETAATRFRRELDRAVELIAERPEAAPPYVWQHQTISTAAVSVLRRLSRLQPADPSSRGCTRSTEAALLAWTLR